MAAKLMLLATTIFLGANTAHATAQISWSDLIDPAAQSFEDPYHDLTYDQIDNVRTVLVIREELKSSSLSNADRKALEGKLKEVENSLAAQNLDADWLISQRWVVAERREKAATAINVDVDGITISMGGFAIPAPPDADGTQIVYLVPERGMCSHTPPPNPNQMIRARLKGDWSPRMMHEPVRLTGRLIAEETRHSFRIVDGEVPMRASFVMEVSKVETIADMQTDAAAVNEWAAGIAERLRASGQLPQENADATQ